MSQVLINEYLGELDRLKKVGGTHRESVVREAFKDLLKGWGKQHDLVFIPEYKLDGATNDTRFVDGALLYELRVPFGYWEAKDAKDDIDAEIAFKFKRGYPQDNIIFEDSTQAVLIQHREEVMRCDVTDVKQLEKLLKLFFAFERAEIADFRRAVAQFKTDLPAVLEALRSMIERAHQANPAFAAASKAFLQHAREAINPSLGEADVREMLIQHILTGQRVALHARQSQCPGMGARPAQGEEAQGPDHPREVRHLPLRRPQERVIDLLARVTTVSVETMRIVDLLATGPR